MSGSRPVRIGSCSGFYGDRLSALREVVTGGPVDVVVGDYLAELTMLILGKDRMRDASLGWARTHLRQLEDCLGEVLERGVRVVTNAGGLNPAGLVDALAEVSRGLGVDPAVAWVDGDDLAPRAADLGWDDALTANAYLGGHGIARALAAGADVVVTGRVTDASLVVGPAAWWHGWSPGDHDALAGAMVAGHVIECGSQATGGNFSGFLDLPRTAEPLGFPVAEVAADGSSVITKHDGTAGAVTVDTVTAQLLYEVQSTHYLGPDATVDLDSVRLSQEGPDRVAVAPVRGLAPPERLKVCVNELGGWRNAVELVLTGLDVPQKAAWVRDQLTPRIAAASVTWSPVAEPAADAASQEAASVLLRCTVKDPDQAPVDRSFTAAVVELALASYPGFTMTAPPGRATPYGVYRAAYVDRSAVVHTVHLPDGSTEVVADPVGTSPGLQARAQGPSHLDQPDRPEVVEARGAQAPSLETAAPERGGPVRRAPLGLVAHARSGDKGGDANVGVWVRDAAIRPEAVAWLLGFLTPDRVRELLPEAADLDVEVHHLPHLGGLNVVLHGLLGDGVAAGTRFDPQAKGLGEWLRSRYVDIPEELL